MADTRGRFISSSYYAAGLPVCFGSTPVGWIIPTAALPGLPRQAGFHRNSRDSGVSLHREILHGQRHSFCGVGSANDPARLKKVAFAYKAFEAGVLMVWKAGVLRLEASWGLILAAAEAETRS